MQQDMIVVLDLGSEQNTLIARDVRALGVYTEIHNFDISADEWKALPNVKGVILNGGPNRVVDGKEIDASAAVYNSGLPLLYMDHKDKRGETWPETETGRKKILKNSCSTCARLRPTGTWKTSSQTRSSNCARRSATKKCCWRSRAASILRS